MYLHSLAMICREHAASYLIYDFMFQVISESTLSNENLTGQFRNIFI